MTESESHPRQQVCIGIVTALPKEFVAVEAMLDNPVYWYPEGDGIGRRYILGKVPSANAGFHQIALALLPEIGNGSAAVRATQLLQDLPAVQRIVMCGIAGGIPTNGIAEEDIRLGDVIVSDSTGVVNYDSVKQTPEGVEYRVLPRPPDPQLLDAVRHLEADRLRRQFPWERLLARAARIEASSRPPDNIGADGLPIKYVAGMERKNSFPYVFVGGIASANRLLRDSGYRDLLRAKFNVKAVEMEGAGISDAAWLNRVGYLVVRGVSDYCDTRKGDVWQGYAATAAAAYVRALLEGLPSSARGVPSIWQSEAGSADDGKVRGASRFVPASSGLLSGFDSRRKIDAYRARMAEWLCRDLRDLVPTSIRTSLGLKKSSEVLDFLGGGGHGQLIGPSGCGKTHLAKHMAVAALRKGVLPVFVRSRYYEGALGELVDESIAHLWQGDGENFLHVCRAQGSRVVLILDGLNECPEVSQQRLLEEMQAVCLQWGVSVLVTAQKEVKLSRELPLESFLFEELARDERRDVVVAYVQHDIPSNADELLAAFQTAYELSLAAEVIAEVRSLPTRASLLDMYCRRVCMKQGYGGALHGALCAMAGQMTRLLVSSISMRDARVAVEPLLSAEGLPYRTFDEVLKCGLLEIQQERCSFRHELIQRYFEAAALARKHVLDQDALSVELQKPVYKGVAEFVVALQESPGAVRICLGRTVDEHQLYDCLMGRWGQIARDLVRADCSTVLRDAEKALRETDLEIETADSQWIDVSVRSRRHWTNRETALMVAVGWALHAGLFGEEVFRLVRRTELSCRDALYRKYGEGGGVKGRIKSILLWRLFSAGGRRDLPVTVIVSACQFGSPGASLERCASPVVKKIISSLGRLTLGELYLVCVLMRFAGSEMLGNLPELLRICWASKVDHLRVECLLTAQSAAGVLGEPQLSEVKVLLSEFDAGNVLLSTVLVDAMVAYGIIDPPVELEGALEEIDAVLNAPQDVQVCEQAHSVVSRLFEEVFQGVYDQAIESLPAEKLARLLTRAALGAPRYSFFVDWILRRLVRLDDRQALPAFLHWVAHFEPEPPVIINVAERYVWALVGCARFLEQPPELVPPKSGVHCAWQLCGHVVFWVNRPGLPDDEIVDRCAPLWWRLTSELIGDAVEPLTEVCFSFFGQVMTDEGPVKRLFDLFGEFARKVFEHALSAEGPFPTIYPSGSSRHRDLVSRATSGLSFVGDWQSVVVLEGLVHSVEHGADAVIALKKLKKRLMEQGS